MVVMGGLERRLKGLIGELAEDWVVEHFSRLIEKGIIDEDELERIFDFLGEYEELVKKYGLYIGACGCCGSPWLVSMKVIEEAPEELIRHLLFEMRLEDSDG